MTERAIPTGRRKDHTLSRIMTARMRGLWPDNEAIAPGWGGFTAVAGAT